MSTFLLLLLSASVLGGLAADPGAAEPLDLRSNSLILVKIWCLVIVFVATFVAGVSPYLVKWNEGFILLGTQFAGGVFLGTALMQFLSDSDEAFESLIARVDYPLAFMLASAGYLFAMLADCVLLYVCRKQSSSHLRDRDVSLQGGVQVQQRKPSSDEGTSQSQIQVGKPGEGTDYFLNSSLFNAISIGDSVLLITALCFHSIFEGIAIGVADTKGRAWRALWIVILHKVFSAIAMGIAILRTIPDRPLVSCIAYAFAFSLSTSVGIAMGIVIDATAPGVVADWIYAIFMGFSGGVFIFISVNHLLFKGYLPQGGSVWVDNPHHKFLAAVLGVGVIAVAMIWDVSSRARAYEGG